MICMVSCSGHHQILNQSEKAERVQPTFWLLVSPVKNNLARDEDNGLIEIYLTSATAGATEDWIMRW